MSYKDTVGLEILECRFMTPELKNFRFNSDDVDECSTDSSPSYILMDEYGQTPDHYYLGSSPSAPPSSKRINQVKRRLNLDSPRSTSENGVENKRRRVSNGHYMKVIEKQRYDTSLGQLTKKFLELLTSSPDGVINLNKACALLSVPKRRIYDITNVLEGAGLLEKKSRNNIQWKGNAVSTQDRIRIELEADIDALEAKENVLDELIHNTRAAISQLKNEDKKYAYLINSDIQGLSEFRNQTLIGIKASPDTHLEAHENFKICLKSEKGEIGAYLFTEETSIRSIESRMNQETIKIENNKISSEGDPVLKYALITEEDDYAPLGKNFLLQTEDQNCDQPFLEIEPPLLDYDYSFSLDDAEGISDLFDTCDFPCA